MYVVEVLSDEYLSFYIIDKITQNHLFKVNFHNIHKSRSYEWYLIKIIMSMQKIIYNIVVDVL